MFQFELKKIYIYCRLLKEHLMVSNMDHTSSAIQEESADGEKQNPRAMLISIVFIAVFIAVIYLLTPISIS